MLVFLTVSDTNTSCVGIFGLLLKKSHLAWQAFANKKRSTVCGTRRDELVKHLVRERHVLRAMVTGPELLVALASCHSWKLSIMRLCLVGTCLAMSAPSALVTVQVRLEMSSLASWTITEQAVPTKIVNKAKTDPHGNLEKAKC